MFSRKYFFILLNLIYIVVSAGDFTSVDIESDHFYKFILASGDSANYEVGFIHVGTGSPYMRANPDNVDIMNYP